MPRGTLFSPSNGGPSADAPGGPRAMPQGETLPACRRGQSRQRRRCLRGVPLRNIQHAEAESAENENF